ncbi:MULTISPECIES: hypothetical protein [Cupriavidus]|jgi:hypothetical protein|uniref:hypothetical protein n=1 Tax=Cupriavidus TaxID=106589 RepID=UPI001365C20C|nr:MULTISPECIES: hypothetical protein [Cupriavidus]MCA3187216.1 hypothetical protein [Cupriavidus sp.]MCA3192117.1 hypothetical protein [Cupriavidus sp.]MCA3197862.1 hypothetical protein [Cupriavidus sp.]MCA3202915.1 hypothetical protein [Cupriavidus sp.]MCA3206465.1 hypothetical protein [Cupriavidus sp.]
MSLYNKKLSISMPWAIVVVTGLLLAILGWLTIILADKPFLAKEGPLWVFASGMASGLVVTLAQFCLSWADARAIDRFRRMGVENVLSNRDEEAYYGRLIQSARANIDVLGSTATRLMQDFADAGSPKPEKQSLIEALKRGVAVRILVAAPARLDDRERNEKCPIARRLFEAIAEKYPSHFEVRYFDATPLASFVRADNELVVGPLLPGVESKHTPALHVFNHSPYAASYLNYFEKTWATAAPLGPMPPAGPTP